LARHYAGREPPAEITLALSEAEGSNARDLLLNPGTKLGPYEIVGAIGAGGMGEVYPARDTKLGRDVAIKVPLDAFAYDPQRLSLFIRTYTDLGYSKRCRATPE